MRCMMTKKARANPRPQPSVPTMITILLLLLACCGISQIQSLEESQNATSPPSTVQQTTITTTAPKHNESNTPLPTTTTSTTTGAPNTNKIESSSSEETKKLITQEAKSSINNNMSNKQQQQATTSDFAPESMEAKVADATTRFGLNFIKNLDKNKENVVISPLSLQNLLNMILLGSDSQSATEQELIKVLGYETTELISRSQQQSSSLDNSLRPHESMRNVLNSIMRATQSVSPSSSSSPSQMSELLNSNSVVLNNTTTDTGTMTAHLETSIDQPSSSSPSSTSTSAGLGAPVNFTLANLILTDESVSLSDCYSKYLKTYYNVKVEKFSKKNKKSTNSSSSETQLPLHERVNQWVKNMTQNQIENLVQASDLEGPLLMILLNAAHFKGRWLYTFNQKLTREQAFFNFGDDKSISDVPFMRQKGNFGYADFGQFNAGQAGSSNSDARGSKTSASEDAETLLTVDAVGGSANNGSSKIDYNNQADSQLPVIELSKEESKRLELTSKLNCSVLMLPFALNDGQELSLVILLPTKRNGLDELIGALSYQNLNEIYKSLSDQQVQVELPKFSFESSHDAKDILERIGLKQMFSEAHLERMFTGTTPKESKHVGKVIHKAKIAVDESGAEAAAASMATVFLRNFIRPPTPTFVADHPFLFIIRHNISNMPLFMGQVNKF